MSTRYPYETLCDGVLLSFDLNFTRRRRTTKYKIEELYLESDRFICNSFSGYLCSLVELILSFNLRDDIPSIYLYYSDTLTFKLNTHIF